jgi:hypothetical protein
MLWFKHDNHYRSTAAIRHIESVLGEAGYARALKLLEIFCECCPRKPFVARIEIKPPYTWRWMAQELGCGTEVEAIRTIELFEDALLIQIPEKVIVQPRKKGQDEIRRPAVIECAGLMEKAEWHNLSNRNRKRLEKEDAPMPADGLFVAAASTPGNDAARAPEKITRLRSPEGDSEQIQKKIQM